ncbi:hypothetical protein BGZ61DRAFT_231500, partial [Ilyonectria robusta]|uniref:uncharacterized protein n=1 Tax=Ilyonectria robusta TaxID=1079257 RepID=UPI001E8CEC32
FESTRGSTPSYSVTESEIGCFTPAWEQSIPRSDNYSKGSAFCENCHGMGWAPRGFVLNDSSLSPFQSTIFFSPESDCISSPIMKEINIDKSCCDSCSVTSVKRQKVWSSVKEGKSASFQFLGQTRRLK